MRLARGEGGKGFALIWDSLGGERTMNSVTKRGGKKEGKSYEKSVMGFGVEGKKGV